jgi:hypothetical protein
MVRRRPPCIRRTQTRGVRSSAQPIERSITFSTVDLQLGDGEGLGHHLGDDRLQALGPLALLGIAGHQHDREIGKFLLRRERQRDPVHQRHADIGQQQVEAAVLGDQDVERLGAVRRHQAGVPVHGEPARDQRAQGSSSSTTRIRDIAFRSRAGRPGRRSR